jgi:hypothetical protein
MTCRSHDVRKTHFFFQRRTDKYEVTVPLNAAVRSTLLFPSLYESFTCGTHSLTRKLDVTEDEWLSSTFLNHFKEKWTLTGQQSRATERGYKSQEVVYKSFRTGRLELQLQIVQLSAIRCSCIDIFWVSVMNFAAITLCVASQRVVTVYFVIETVRKLLDTPSYSARHSA